jgi:hypothetical protein
LVSQPSRCIIWKFTMRKRICLSQMLAFPSKC